MVSFIVGVMNWCGFTNSASGFAEFRAALVGGRAREGKRRLGMCFDTQVLFFWWAFRLVVGLRRGG